MEVPAWIVDYSLDVLKAIFAEGLGFLVLATVGGLLLRHHIVHAIERGFNAIAETFAKSFSIHILPEIVRIREHIEKRTLVGEKIQKAEEEIPTTEEIEKSLQLVNKDIAAGKFKLAEQKLLELRAQHPKDFRLLDSLFSLYRNPRYQKKADALELLLSVEEDFKQDARFYNRLAHAYMELKGIITTYQAKRNAVGAAQTCIKLNPSDPNHHKLLGLVYFVFDDLKQAISITEKALEMVKDDKKIEISCKNNLSFYYAAAERQDLKEKAIGYAREAVEYNPKTANYIDTLGFVIMTYGKTREDLLEAISLFNQALNLEPYDADIARNLQEAYMKMKNLAGT